MLDFVARCLNAGWRATLQIHKPDKPEPPPVSPDKDLKPGNPNPKSPRLENPKQVSSNSCQQPHATKTKASARASSRPAVPLNRLSESSRVGLCQAETLQVLCQPNGFFSVWDGLSVSRDLTGEALGCGGGGGGLRQRRRRHRSKQFGSSEELRVSGSPPAFKLK